MQTLTLPQMSIRPAQIRVTGGTVKLGNRRVDVRVAPVLDELRRRIPGPRVLEFLKEGTAHLEILSVLRPLVFVEAGPVARVLMVVAIRGPGGWSPPWPSESVRSPCARPCSR